jgi:hypothetical protein
MITADKAGVSSCKRVPRLGIPLLSLFFVLAITHHAVAGTWGPWSVSDDAPALYALPDNDAPTVAPREPQVQPIAATPFLWSLRFYQRFITHIDGDRCPMYPTCSAYSVHAFRKHGPVIGVVMTADRLLHEIDEQRYVPLRRIGNRLRYDDPLGNNDFWWYGQ